MGDKLVASYIQGGVRVTDCSVLLPQAGLLAGRHIWVLEEDRIQVIPYSVKHEASTLKWFKEFQIGIEKWEWILVLYVAL